MANYNFKEDLIIGESGEMVVVNDLKPYGINLKHKNNDNKYDILMEKNGEEVTYEIKTDVYCSPRFDTGNMFIEFECRGKSSGIMVTEAKWFVTYYKHLNEIWYIKTIDLLKLIEYNNFRTTEFSGDAGSNTKGYLIPRKNFIDKFIVRKPNE